RSTTAMRGSAPSSPPCSPTACGCWWPGRCCWRRGSSWGCPWGQGPGSSCPEGQGPRRAGPAPEPTAPQRLKSGAKPPCYTRGPAPPTPPGTATANPMSAPQTQLPTPLFGYRKFWAECFGTAPFLPTTREEMERLGWDSCDVIIVTGDAYVDHTSFGMAEIGRVREGRGYRDGIIAQPDWTGKTDFQRLGPPNLFWGVAAGNMDSMINRYTADHKIRKDDAYTPGDVGGKRPDRAVTVYSQRCREAYKGVPVVIGSIEASLRRIAHYDYWSNTVKRSILLDAKADLLLYGNAERAIVELAHRLARGEAIADIQDIRGTAFVRKTLPEGWLEIDSTEVDEPSRVDPIPNPYPASRVLRDGDGKGGSCATGDADTVVEERPVQVIDLRHGDRAQKRAFKGKSYIRLPAWEQVREDPVLYAHASRI